MVVYDVAIATRNSKSRYQIINLLEKLRLNFVVCAPNESVCGSARCIIAMQDEYSELSQYQGHLVLIQNSFDRDTIAISVMTILNDSRNPSSVSIGVDPGMRYGLALLVDGLFVYSRICSSPRRAADTTKHWSVIINHLFSGVETVIRIGTGSRLYLTLYLRELESRLPNNLVELVDEHHTTLRGESDTSSAAIIAGRHGEKLHDFLLTLDPKPGYIRSLKRYVRKSTDESKRITTDDAMAILSGTLTLDGFLEKS